MLGNGLSNVSEWMTQCIWHLLKNTYSCLSPQFGNANYHVEMVAPLRMTFRSPFASCAPLCMKYLRSLNDVPGYELSENTKYCH